MSSIKIAIGNMALAASVLAGAAQAGMCQWKDEKGLTHFAAHCPLDSDAKIEARYTGGTVPLNQEPAPSLIIEQANRLNAKRAAEAARTESKAAHQRAEKAADEARRANEAAAGQETAREARMEERFDRLERQIRFNKIMDDYHRQIQEINSR